MTDVFLLLMLAGAGDELQGIKRGIMEMADILVINKADGDNLTTAKLASKVYENAIHLFTPQKSSWLPPVLTCSSLTGDGVANVWQKINDFESMLKDEDFLEDSRNNQKKLWLEQTLSSELMQRIRADDKVRARLIALEQQVITNMITPTQAVEEIMQSFFFDKE